MSVARYIHLAVVIVVIAAIVLAWVKRATIERSGASGVGLGSLEEKLAALQACGLPLDEQFTIQDLLKTDSRSSYERPGWDLVLVGLAIEDEEEPFASHCKILWHFDSECIEDNGDYARIVARMSEMTEGALPLENIKDRIDIEAGKAQVSFDLHGQRINLDLKVQDDWADPMVFTKLAELLQQTDPSKLFVIYDFHSQDCVIGCVTRARLKQLNDLGVKFEPLD